MKRFFILLLVLVLSLKGFAIEPQIDGEENLSPFVGKWEWECNDRTHQFYIWCGERNDSLLFAIGGVFFQGNRIHLPEWDKNEKFIQMVRIKKPKKNIAKSKINEFMSDFYCGDDKKFNDVLLELLNDTVMRFILNDNKVYWPDTALMILQKKGNIEFSQQEYEHLYKEE